jgi:GT2 family glycosyltransferase
MIYVIVPVYRGLEQAKRFISCLKAQTCEEIKLIVVNDGCMDYSIRWIEENYRKVIVINTGGNYFWAGSLNYGLWFLADWKEGRISANDAVLLINIDRTFAKDYIEKAVRYINPKTLVVSAGYDSHGRQISGGLYVDWPKFSFKVSDTPNICGTTGLFMTAKDFVESGGFDKRLPHHWADTEFVWRLLKRGFKLEAPKELKITCDTQTVSIYYPDSIKELFNWRCSQHPIHKSIFILRCCPWRYKFINLLRAWYWLWRVL